MSVAERYGGKQIIPVSLIIELSRRGPNNGLLSSLASGPSGPRLGLRPFKFRGQQTSCMVGFRELMFPLLCEKSCRGFVFRGNQPKSPSRGHFSVLLRCPRKLIASGNEASTPPFARQTSFSCLFLVPPVSLSGGTCSVGPCLDIGTCVSFVAGPLQVRGSPRTFPGF